MKVYIVEDHEAMRIILKRLLRKNFPGITQIGESDTAEKALEEIPVFGAHLILVDISLPGMDGIEMIRRLKPEVREVCILVVTGHEVDIYREESISAGAHCIVSKNDTEDLLRNVRRLLDKCKEGGCM
ncbi:MAG: response regulator transcription factor [Chitinispirillaceae bacterium]